jgi:uncharacterized membrane protein
MMKKVLLMSVMAGLLVSLTACTDEKASQDAAADPPQAAEIIRGDYLFSHEVRALRPCGEEDDLWVIDPTGILAKHHQLLMEGRTGDIRIRVIAKGHTGPAPTEGFGADYPGTVTIDEVIYAALEGFGCDFDLNEFVFRAYGNEPFWHVAVYSDHMKLTWPGSPAQAWTEVVREDVGDTIVFRGTGTELPAVLTILPGPGYDDMSGTYFHHKARFQWGEHDMEGPALMGLAEGGS